MGKRRVFPHYVDSNTAMDNMLTKPEDFLKDISFLQYCMGVDPAIARQWDEWLEQNPEKGAAVQEAKRLFAVMHGYSGNTEADLAIFQVLLQQRIDDNNPVITSDRRTKHAKIHRLQKWGIAAALLLAVSGLTLFYLHKQSPSIGIDYTAKSDRPVADALPGTSRATLTLSNGKEVDLDSLQQGLLKEQNGTTIRKGQDILVYNKGMRDDEPVAYNVLSTPRGGEYQLVLPDGTKVWLNAASSLRFPTKFLGKDRVVYLKGEAYFDVARNAQQSFHVQLSDGLDAQALGTQFDVMDYNDETMVSATLLEGKVKMSYESHDAILAPAQQAVFGRGSRKITVGEADTDKVIAWKLGKFEFEDDDLPVIMRQLSRWYDVDVAFASAIPDKHYAGSISRSLTLMQVLEILKLAGIKYQIEGKKLTIEKI